LIDALIVPVYVMLDNPLFDKPKHPLEAQSGGNNEHANTVIA